MAKRRSKKTVPIMLFWSKRDQLRFIESVERFQSLVNDMAAVLEPAKRKKAAKTPPKPKSTIARCPKCKVTFDAAGRDRCPSCSQAFYAPQGGAK